MITGLWGLFLYSHMQIKPGNHGHNLFRCVCIDRNKNISIKKKMAETGDQADQPSVERSCSNFLATISAQQPVDLGACKPLFKHLYNYAICCGDSWSDGFWEKTLWGWGIIKQCQAQVYWIRGFRLRKRGKFLPAVARTFTCRRRWL